MAYVHCGALILFLAYFFIRLGMQETCELTTLCVSLCYVQSSESLQRLPDLNQTCYERKDDGGHLKEK